MSLIKLSVENLESNERFLHEIDMRQSLEENIKGVCQLFQRPYEKDRYGLKIVSTNDGVIVNTHISSDNFNEIKDGYFLKLDYSLDYYIDTIFEFINGEARTTGFEYLYNLSVDPEFIKQLAKTDKHRLLIEYFTTNETKDRELTACLIAIVHLFQKGFLDDFTPELLNKVIGVIETPSETEQTIFALSILHKILVHRDTNFNKWKEIIITQLPITELIPFIWSEDTKDLQFGALLLINTIIRCCKGDKRQLLIKEINLKQNREYIYKHVIMHDNINKKLAHELYVYQTFLLSLFAAALNSSISLANNALINREEFEINDDNIKTNSVLIDFEEDLSRNKTGSTENLVEIDKDTRISLASFSSKQSEDTRNSSRINSTNLNSFIDIDTSSISVLTLEALRYYKRYHSKNFYQTQIEEKVYEPGIFATSERIIRMLAKLLHIGIEPDRTSTFYQPIIFNCSSRTPFFLELFSRTMWLLSKTRREMKASTINDYPKVINVLEQQIQIVLQEKPKDFKELTDKMVSTTYRTVMEHWQKEKQKEMNLVLDTNPSVQILKQHYIKINEKLIFEQRMQYLFKNTLFPKIVEKKIVGNFTVKLSENCRQLFIRDFDVNSRKYTGEQKTYNISDITHIIKGRACPHVKNNLVRDGDLAFSIIIDQDEYINFKAKDKRMASYWIDALSLLLDKETRSDFYKRELDELVRMDLSLHLIELQNVAIPNKPPPVPPSPFMERPPIPPKPQITL